MTIATPGPMPMRLADVGMALGVALIWGMGFVVAKGVMADFPPILLTAFRFAITALAMVWFVPWPKGAFARLFAVSAVGSAIQFSLTFTGLKGLTAGLAVLILQLEVPFLVLLGALLLGERPGLRKWAGIAIAFAGIALIGGRTRLGGEALSILLVIGGAFTWALGQVMVRGLGRMSGLAVTTWTSVIATPQLFLMSALFEHGQIAAIRAAGPGTWLAVVYLGLGMTGLGYLLWNSLILRHEVGRVAPALLLMPLFAIAGGILFLGEAPEPGRLLGGLVVLAGVAIITVDPARLRPQARS